MPDKQTFLDFTATLDKYGDADVAINKFPELTKSYDKKLLYDFVATLDKYNDFDIAYSKFPEFQQDKNPYIPQPYKNPYADIWQNVQKEIINTKPQPKNEYEKQKVEAIDKINEWWQVPLKTPENLIKDAEIKYENEFYDEELAKYFERKENALKEIILKEQEKRENEQEVKKQIANVNYTDKIKGISLPILDPIKERERRLKELPDISPQEYIKNLTLSEKENLYRKLIEREEMLDNNNIFFTDDKELIGEKLADMRYLREKLIKEQKQKQTAKDELSGFPLDKYVHTGRLRSNNGYELESEIQLGVLAAVKKVINKTQETLNAPKKSTGTVSNMGRAVVDKFDPASFISIGISDLLNTGDIMYVMEKADKDPNSLTDSEKLLMDALLQKTYVDLLRQGDISGWYQAGDMALTSLEMSIQFLVTSGISGVGKIAEEVAVRGLSRYFRMKLINQMKKKGIKKITEEGIEEFAKRNFLSRARQFGQKALTKGVGFMADVYGGGLTQAPLMPMFYQGGMENRMGTVTGKKDDGSYEIEQSDLNMAEAYWKSLQEIASERSGEHFVKAFGGVYRGMAKLLPNGRLQDFMLKAGQIIGTPNKFMSEKMKFDAFGEPIEEAYNNTINYVTGVSSKQEFNEFWKAENLGIMSLGFAPMSVWGIGVNGINVSGLSSNVIEKRAELRGNLKLKGLKDVEINNFFKNIETGKVKDFRQYVEDVIANTNGFDKNGKLNEIGKEINKQAFEYTMSVAQYDFATAYQSEQKKIEKNINEIQKQANYREQIEREREDELNFIQKHVSNNINESNANIDIVSLKDGNFVYIVSGNIKYDEEGNIDWYNSDENIYYRNQNGEVLPITKENRDIFDVIVYSNSADEYYKEYVEKTNRKYDNALKFPTGSEITDANTGETSEVKKITDEGVVIDTQNEETGEVTEVVLSPEEAEALAGVPPTITEGIYKEYNKTGKEIIIDNDNGDGTYNYTVTDKDNNTEKITNATLAEVKDIFKQLAAENAAAGKVEAGGESETNTPAKEEDSSSRPPFLNEQEAENISDTQTFLDNLTKNKDGSVDEGALTAEQLIQYAEIAVPERFRKDFLNDKLKELNKKKTRTAIDYQKIDAIEKYLNEQQAIKDEQRKAQQEKEAQQRAEKAAAEKTEQERIIRERENTAGIPDVSEDTAANARLRGFRVQNGHRIDRQQPIEVTNYTEQTRKFSDKNIVPVKRTIVDVSKLQPSHINKQRNINFFLTEAQPKERIDSASEISSDNIAAKNNPPEITGGVGAYTGAPVVNSRGEVIQGNNRVIGLKKMYLDFAESAQKYKEYLAEHAAEYGITAEQIMAMESPVAVDIADVTDEQAIILGQMNMADTESGGIQRIPALQTAQKLGDKIVNFSNILLNSEEEEMPIGDIVRGNGKKSLDYLYKEGAINDTQYQSAFKNGNLTPEVVSDLQNIIQSILFKDGNDNIKLNFEQLPDKAKKALLQTVFRNLQGEESNNIIHELQDAIEIYANLIGYSDFSNAKTKDDVRREAMAWYNNAKIDFNNPENTVDNRKKYSNFAVELAIWFKTETQKTQVAAFNKLYDYLQGKGGDMFNKTTSLTLPEAIKEIYNIDYKPINKNEYETGRYERPVHSVSANSISGEQGQNDTGGGTQTFGAAAEIIPTGETPTPTPTAAETAGQQLEIVPEVQQTDEAIATPDVVVSEGEQTQPKQVTIRFFDGSLQTGEVIDRKDGKITIQTAQGRKFTVPENRIVEKTDYQIRSDEQVTREINERIDKEARAIRTEIKNLQAERTAKENEFAMARLDIADKAEGSEFIDVSPENYNRVVVPINQRISRLYNDLAALENSRKKQIADAIQAEKAQMTLFQIENDEELRIKNEKFNTELDNFKAGTHKGVLHLGSPLEILRAAGIKESEITIEPSVLKAKLEQHGLTTEELKGLAKAIQSPLMVYEWGDKAKSTIIITELTRSSGDKITVAIGTERKGKKLEVNDISSIYGKSAERTISDFSKAIGENPVRHLKDNLKYVEKEKALNWLGLAAPKAASSQTEKDIAKVIQNFKNPNILDKNLQTLTNNRFVPITWQEGKEITNQLEKSGVAKTVTWYEGKDDKKISGFADKQEFHSKDGSVMGFRVTDKNGDVHIYLDSTKANANTPMHEFAGAYIGDLRKENHPIWQKGKELIKDSWYYDKLKNDKNYKFESEDALIHEALEWAVGDNFEKDYHSNKDKGFLDKVSDLLKEFWNWVGNKLGLRGLSPERISTLTLDELIKGIQADVLSGRNIKAELNAQEHFRTHPDRLPLTLSVFERQEFKDLRGKNINPVVVQQMLNRSGIKMIEKLLINDIINKKYKGQKSVDYNELEAAVRATIIPLEKVISKTYSDYGMNDLSGSRQHDEAYTVILNFPNVEHGQTGHLGRDFESKNRRDINYIPKQLDNNTWIAVEENYSANANENNIYQFVGTTGSKEEVEQWISDFENKMAFSPVNRGMYGHFRVWKDGDITYIAEVQSDYFQNFAAKTELTKEAKGYSEIHVKQIEAIKKLKEEMGISEQGGFFFKGTDTPKFKEREKEINKQFEKDKEALYEKMSPEEKQFIASQKVWERRMMHEAVREAVQNGSEIVLFPAPHTIAVIEKYTGGNKPYEVMSQQHEGRLAEGDKIDDINGESLVTDVRYDGDFTALPLNDVTIETTIDEYAKREADNNWEDIVYSAKSSFADIENITRAELESADFGGDWDIAKDVLLDRLSDVENATVSLYDVQDDVVERIEKEVSDRLDEDYFEQELGYGKAVVTRYGDIYLWKNEVYGETYKQPDKYSSVAKENFDPTDLSDSRQRVLEKYQGYENMLKDDFGAENVSIYEDADGYDWYRLDLNAATKNRPVVAFQFIGEQGAAALDKAEEATVRLDNLAVAREMELQSWENENAEVQDMKKRISDWLSAENLEWAKGKTLNEIIDRFGDELEAIAYINPVYLQYFGDNIDNNRVFSGKGYFIDHAINHHSEVKSEEYNRIQEILNNPDEIKLDKRTPNKTSLIFIKKYDNYFAEIVNVDKNSDGKIVFHKTYYYKEKTPQKALPNVELKTSLMDGLPIISPVKTAAVPRNISALNDGTKVQNFLIPNNISKENAKKIKLATGWERGGDGKWRYEISEKEQIRYIPAAKNGRNSNVNLFTDSLEEVIDYPELFKAYPEFRNIEVQIISGLNVGGAWIRTSRGLEGDANGVIKVNANNSNIQRLNVIIHEIQHAIQEIEGFAKGGNLKNLEESKDAAIIVNWVKELREARKNNPDTDISALHDKIALEYRKNGLEELIPHGDVIDKAHNFVYKDISELEKKANTIRSLYETPVEYYKRIAGEAEARNAGNRMNMTAEERRASLAQETEDVAREDQIFLYDNLENSEKNRIFAENNVNYENTGNQTRMGNRGTMERSTLHGLVGEQPQGRGIEQTINAAIVSGRSGTTAQGVPQRWDKSRFLAQLEVSALENGTWINDIKDVVNSQKKLKGGFENEPYVSKDGINVIKLNNLNFLNDNDTQYEFTRDFDYFIDRLNSHNELFPKDKYQIIGFAENTKGEVCVVLSQPFVENAELATMEQVDEWMAANGFEKGTLSNGLQGYSNGKYELSDVKPQNVLVDTNGDLRFIDLDISSVEHIENKEQRTKNKDGEVHFQIAPTEEGGSINRVETDSEGNVISERPISGIMDGAELGRQVTDSFGNIVEPEYVNDKKQQKRDKRAKQMNQSKKEKMPDSEIFNKTHRQVNKKINKVTQHFADKFIHVKHYQEVLENVGIKITDDNNFYMQAEAISSKSEKEIEKFKAEKFAPLSKTVTAVMEKGGYDYRDVDTYVKLKHGLERNPYYRADDIKANRKQLPDYSGMTNIVPAEMVEQYGSLEAAAQVMVDEFENKIGKELIDNLWEKIRAVTDFTLMADYMRGRISLETMNKVKSMFKFYVPLRGFDGEIAADKMDYSINGRNLMTDDYKTKETMGRTSRADDSFAFMAQMAQQAIIRGNKNLLNQTFLRLARKENGNTMFVSETYIDKATGQKLEPEYNADPKIMSENLADFNKKMKERVAAGEVTKEYNDNVNFGMFAKQSEAKQHIVTVYEDGKKYDVIFNVDVAIPKAINGLNIKTKPWENDFVDAVRAMTRAMAKNMTTRRTTFIGKNFVRDYIFANMSIAAKENGKYFKDFNKHIGYLLLNPDNVLWKYTSGAQSLLGWTVEGKKQIGKDITGEEGKIAGKFKDLHNQYAQWLTEFVMNGGETGLSKMQEFKKLQKEVQKEIEKGSSDPYYPLKMYFKGVGIANNFIENATRFSAYCASREQGRSIKRSVFDAKEISINFNRSGTGIPNLKSLMVFTNASIQALYTAANLTAKNPKRMSAIIGSFVVVGIMQRYLNQLIGMALGGDDPDEKYWQLSDWDRQNNFCLWTGSGFLKIPISQEYRVFYKIGDNIQQIAQGKNGVAATFDILAGFADLLPSFAEAPMPSWEDVRDGNFSEWGKNLLASETFSAVQPLAQLALNRDFKGQKIYEDNPYNSKQFEYATPEYLKAKTDKSGKTKAPDFVVAFSKVLNNMTGGDDITKGWAQINPDVINHLAYSYFSGIWDAAVGTVNIAEKGYETGKILLSDERDNSEIKDLWKTKDFPTIRSFYTSEDLLNPVNKIVNNNYYRALKEAEAIVTISKEKLKDYAKQKMETENEAEIEELDRKMDEIRADIDKIALYKKMAVTSKMVKNYKAILWTSTDIQEKIESADKINKLQKGVVQANKLLHKKDLESAKEIMDDVFKIFTEKEITEATQEFDNE